jgi:hypothetical protein
MKLRRRLNIGPILPKSGVVQPIAADSRIPKQEGSG